MNYPADKDLPTIPEHQTERFQELIFRLYQCCQDRMLRQSKQFDLPDAELRCLRLFDQERHLTPKRIATQMGAVKSRITKIIDGLVAKTLIQRAKDPEDSRVSRLSLTPQGQKKLDQVNRSLASANEQLLSRMTSEQRTTLMTHLEMLRASMEAVKDNGTI